MLNENNNFIIFLNYYKCYPITSNFLFFVNNQLINYNEQLIKPRSNLPFQVISRYPQNPGVNKRNAQYTHVYIYISNRQLNQYEIRGKHV